MKIKKKQPEINLMIEKLEKLTGRKIIFKEGLTLSIDDASEMNSSSLEKVAKTTDVKLTSEATDSESGMTSIKEDDATSQQGSQFKHFFYNFNKELIDSLKLAYGSVFKLDENVWGIYANKGEGEHVASIIQNKDKEWLIATDMTPDEFRQFIKNENIL
jgi:hypothetical protein